MHCQTRTEHAEGLSKFKRVSLTLKTKYGTVVLLCLEFRGLVNRTRLTMLPIKFYRDI